MEKITNRRAIEKISSLVKEYKLTPTEFRYCCAQVRIKNNLVIEKRNKRLPDYLNAGEIYILHQKAMQNKFDGVLIEFLIFTGLRISEANKLQIQDLDFNDNKLKVIEGKGKKDRYVPLTNNLIQKLNLFLGDRKRGFVFAKSDETKYSIRALQKRIKNNLNACNFEKKLSTHSLRHTFACLCLAKGMQLTDIKLMMGHSSIKTTEIYAKLELGSIKNQFLQLMDQRG